MDNWFLLIVTKCTIYSITCTRDFSKINGFSSINDHTFILHWRSYLEISLDIIPLYFIEGHIWKYHQGSHYWRSYLQQLDSLFTSPATISVADWLGRSFRVWEVRGSIPGRVKPKISNSWLNSSLVKRSTYKG